MNANPPGGSWDAIVLHPDDEVAVALHDLATGDNVRVRRAGVIEHLAAAADIPLGHKIALRAVSRGSVVRKYGNAIGVAKVDIAPGEHVHVHNLASQRATSA